MYTLVVFIHVFSAVIWIGGVIGVFAVASYTRSHDGPEVADRVLVAAHHLLNYYLAGPILVVASGVTMVVMSDSWAFSQPWVYLAIVVFLVGSGISSAAGRPDREMAKLREAGDIGGAAFAGLQAAYLRAVWSGALVLAAIEILMVFKPGA